MISRPTPWAFLALSLPLQICSAQSTHGSPAESAPPRPATTLTASAAEDFAARGFVLHGAPLARVLLLVGDPRGVIDSVPGRRVEARLCRWVELDATGSWRLALDEPRPVFGQVWTPPGPASRTPAGSWSDLIVSLPTGGQLPSTASPGDLVVTEFMKDPSAVSDANGEWIEVRNMLPWRLDIDGVVLSDASGASFVFDGGGGPLYLRPHEFFVVGANADTNTNGGVPVDWTWSGFSLKNSSDEIYLHDRFGALLDRVEYDDGVLWPDTPGSSISLDPAATNALGNDDPTAWCHSSSALGSGGDTGTPGALNDTCP